MRVAMNQPDRATVVLDAARTSTQRSNSEELKKRVRDVVCAVVRVQAEVGTIATVLESVSRVGDPVKESELLSVIASQTRALRDGMLTGRLIAEALRRTPVIHDVRTRDTELLWIVAAQLRLKIHNEAETTVMRVADPRRRQSAPIRLAKPYHLDGNRAAVRRIIEQACLSTKQDTVSGRIEEQLAGIVKELASAGLFDDA